MIYEGSPAHHLPGLAILGKRKLESHHRCLYLNSPAVIAQMRSCLLSAGVDVNREIEQGALVLCCDQAHLIDGRFDVDRMLAFLTDSVAEAVRDGYRGLWATGDMTWEFGDEKNFAKLLEYEYALERLFERLPALSGVCQFHAETLPSDAIQWGLCTHRAVYINEAVSKVNPYYAPAEVFAYRAPHVARNKVREMFARSHEWNEADAAYAPL